MKTINPLEVFGSAIMQVQKPSRYLGGDFGQTVKPFSNNDVLYNFGMAFPDLYEIAMSNQAIRIIYNNLNAYDSIRAERVFAPEKDFEQLLIQKDIPLYTLESGIPLHELDMIGFSIGYELGITGVLCMLDRGKIPLLKKDRTEHDPIVIAGGCGITNPVPLQNFFDAFFIGEAEHEMFELIHAVSLMKQRGASREEMLSYFCSHESVWVPGKKAKRAVYNKFGQEDSVPSYFPIANIKPVQEHGVIEIMRGCPNGCRFCHAGIYYRPQRMKPIDRIIREADELILKAGCREISLNSLSSGDYEGIGQVLDILTERYKHLNVSFQLPSLKVNSFTLPLLEKLSEVRKSGLTFAVETPDELWQLSLNKEVFEERLFDIIMNAKKRGWSKAKFYFMVGLPVSGSDKTEEEAIVDFLLKIQSATRIQCTVNVGTFIPKPHTPYQWAKQLSMEESRQKLNFIRYSLPKGKFKVSTHDEFVSFIEGIISRGDERVGDILLSAYNKGCRLDAWEDHIQKELWFEAIKESGIDVQTLLSERDIDKPLAWDDISMGVSKTFLKNEARKSQQGLLTKPCIQDCDHPCGICGSETKISIKNVSQDVYKSIPFPDELTRLNIERQEHNIPVLYRVLFQFDKFNQGIMLPHLALQELFHKAFLRSAMPIVYTSGFNPVPKLELACSLSIGIGSDGEIASCLLYENMNTEDFIQAINVNLPEGIRISKAVIFPVSNKLKRESLASLYWGASYTIALDEESYALCKAYPPVNQILSQCSYTEDKHIFQLKVPFALDKKLRTVMEEAVNKSIFTFAELKRIESYAVYNDEVMTFFKAYELIAEKHAELL